MNHITIAGHLGADPETRFTSSGQKVTTLRIACNSRRGGKEETTWYKVTIWGDQFDKILPYFKKGSPIIVHGELLKPEIFNDREGNPQISLNVVAQNISFSPFGRGEKKEESTAQQQPSGFSAGQSFPSSAAKPPENPFASQVPQSGFTQPVQGQGAPAEEFSDEEIPF